MLIINNIFLSNLYGIYISNLSSDNKIHHNYLVCNAYNAYDNGSNVWNNSYPSGGNYWGDYTGKDEYSGPNQDQSGSDGIGDTPYPILGGVNKDKYPTLLPLQCYGEIEYAENATENFTTYTKKLNITIDDSPAPETGNALFLSYTKNVTWWYNELLHLYFVEVTYNISPEGYYISSVYNGENIILWQNVSWDAYVNQTNAEFDLYLSTSCDNIS